MKIEDALKIGNGLDLSSKTLINIQYTSRILEEKFAALLKEYDWTGNIRELRNVVERLIILSGNEVTENDVKLFASK